MKIIIKEIVIAKNIPIDIINSPFLLFYICLYDRKNNSNFYNFKYYRLIPRFLSKAGYNMDVMLIYVVEVNI